MKLRYFVLLVAFISGVATSQDPGDCGLLAVNDVWYDEPIPYPIPLVSVDVTARVTQGVAEVEVAQVYVNRENVPIEAVYHFPLNPEGAVSGFRAEVDGRIIKGVVKEKAKARKAYEKAIRNQTSAYLGEEVKPDVFKLRVGFLRPGTQVKIVFRYVTEVKNEPGTNRIRFYIPTTVAPRYISPTETDEPAQALGNMTFSAESPALLTLKVEVVLLGPIQSITSPTHNITVHMVTASGPNVTLHAASVELAEMVTDMDRDFVINITPAEVHHPKLYSEKDVNGTTAVMIHFIPDFNISQHKTELLFVLDRSGSMWGRSIELARQALKVFLHSMPADCYFNIIGFGSHFQFLFPASVKYSDDTLRQAIRHATSVGPDLGGTEILRPLQSIYGKSAVPGYKRQIFLLTDGQVSNTEQVIALIQRNAAEARVFAFGIGDGASHHLVEGSAKAGGGTSAFVTNNEALDSKVLNQLKVATRPAPVEVQLEWEWPQGSDSSSVEDDAVMIRQSPKRIPPIHSGSQVLIFGFFETKVPPISVTLKAHFENGVEVAFKLNHSSTNELGRGLGMLHKLAAIKYIRDVETELTAMKAESNGNYTSTVERWLMKDITDISIKNGVASSLTSFIAVDERRSGDRDSKNSWVTMETRQVANQVPNGAPDVGLRKPSFRPVPALALPPPPPQYMPPRQHFPPLQSLPLPTAPARESFDVSSHHMILHMPKPEFERPIQHFPTATYPSFSFPSSEEDEQLLGEYDEDIPTTTDSPSDNSRLMELVQEQSFDGSFNITQKLAGVLGSTLEDLRRDATSLGLSDEVFATVLAIQEFTTRFQDEKERWELVEEKARRWLSTQVEDVDGVFRRVGNFQKN